MPKKILIVVYCIIALAISLYFAQKYASQWNMIHIVMFILPAVLITLFLLFRGWGSSFFWGKTAKAREVLANGLPGTARVTALGKHSLFASYRINKQPVLNLSLRVQPQGASPYDVRFNLMIPEYAVPQFQPGASFAVKIDRDNAKAIVYDNTSFK